MGRTSSSLVHRVVVAVGILSLLVAAAVASPGPARSAAPSAQGAKHDKAKKDKDKKGKDDPAPAPPALAPAPAPPATSAAPGSSAVPAPTVAPAVPGASAAPTVALDTPSTTPTVAQSVGVAVASGTVYVRTAEGRAALPLTAASAIPVGAHVDARAGTVELTSALDAAGATQTATFSGAVFVVRQPSDAEGLTRIVLTGGPRCAARTSHAKTATALAARRRKPVRTLWAEDDHGRFQTQGRGSVATVRGTRWLTQDFCDGTLTRVTRGAVAVRDLARRQTVVVRAGHRYFAAR
jgi:hypothetical protein